MIGSHTALHFALQGFTHVVLFSRSASDLARDAAFITANAPSASIYTYAADVTDRKTFRAAHDKAMAEVGVPEVVIFNAARIKYGYVWGICDGGYRDGF